MSAKPRLVSAAAQPPFPRVSPPPGGEGPENLLAEANALGIPWERILSEEIRAERALRLCLANVGADWPLWPAFWILPGSLLHSWRVRDRIHILAWRASRDSCEAAARQLRDLHAHLLGRQNGRGCDATLMAKHFWFGYQRVLSLQRIGRVAEKVRGELEERIASVAKKTGCSIADAEWGVRRADSRRESHCLDDAMRRARHEGYELPQDETEFRAFRRLQRFVKSSPHLSRLESPE